MKIKFKRFNKPHALKRIGRPLLARFFAHFQPECTANALALPPPDLTDSQYFGALARLLLSPAGLPDSLNEALFAIAAMACPYALERLQADPEWPALQRVLQPGSGPEDIAMQVWLVAPALLAGVHNAQRLRRLTAFEYVGAKVPQNQRSPFTVPAPAALETLAASLDAWFALNQRGEQTARIELYPLDGEFWFLVRHGDTFTRAPAVERQKTEVIHFRPERDDVIVYSPEHDELRLNARTKGERDLYRAQFGLHLRGSEDYFSERRTYTLEPLRSDGQDALDPDGLEGISKITLRQIEVAWDNGLNEVLIRAADDLFQCAAASPTDPFPKGSRLARAAFDLHFADSARPRPVEIRPPNILKLGRHCDARLVARWLTKRGFHITK